MIGHLFEVVTIGLPFCAFKIIAGLHFGQYWLVAIGVVDLIINSTNFLSLILMRRRLLNSCLITVLVAHFKKKKFDKKDLYFDLGNALDVFVSFLIVAIMIGSGEIGNLTARQLNLWNICVVLNVLGAGYGRLSQSIKQLRRA